MHSNRLTGKFPASLLDLMDLSELRLSNNSFRYSAIPQQMQMLDTTPKCTFAPPHPPPTPHHPSFGCRKDICSWSVKCCQRHNTMHCQADAEHAETCSYSVYMCMCVIVVVKHHHGLHMQHQHGCASGVRNTKCCLVLTVNQPVSMCVTMRPQQH